MGSKMGVDLLWTVYSFIFHYHKITMSKMKKKPSKKMKKKISKLVNI